jgi:hypothetical protein
MTDPIKVDIGGAIQQLQDNPELTAMLNGLVFGDVAAQTIAAQEALLKQMAAALKEVKWALFSNDMTIRDRADQSARLALAAHNDATTGATT